MPCALTETTTAISADEFAPLLQTFAPLADKIALAISGGGDSMALALCVKRWAQRPCIAFIVDHGLRAESATEATLVKSRLEQIGIQTEILRWEHAPLAGRVHEKARTARYNLLTEACRRHGADDLLIAHHRDDQAETILMRLSKGSGVEGLAGMAAQSVRDGIRFLRPFLSVPKTRLIATCETENIPFVTDPSNKSEKYARGRLRNIMPLLATEGMTTESLARRTRSRSQGRAQYLHKRISARCGSNRTRRQPPHRPREMGENTTSNGSARAGFLSALYSYRRPCAGTCRAFVSS